jgi:lipopolysaccharide export system ATP-binding protein
MSGERLRGWIGEASASDVSALIALRALAARDRGDADVSRAEWLTALREEMLRWYGPSTGHTEEFAGITAFPDSDAERYLDERIVPMLTSAGLVQLVGNGAAGEQMHWQAARVAPEALAAESGAVRLLDERIGAILEHTGYTSDGGAAVLEESLPAPKPTPTRHHDPVPGGETLRATGLVKTYRKRRVVNEVDLHVSQGEIVGLLGPNGAGKTTSFYMMVGLINPDKGRVYIGDRELTGVPMYRRAKAGIGYLSQEPSIFRRLTVEDNVLAILQTLGLPKPEQKRRLEELLDELGIKHLRGTRAYSLSGGERRRLEITRALVGRPKFMLLDEPFAGVDPIAVHDIQQIVAGLRERGIGVLISDHNVEQTLDIVDRAYIMYEGRVRLSGTVEELVWNDEAAEIYLGPTLTARMRERYSRPEPDEAA